MSLLYCTSFLVFIAFFTLLYMIMPWVCVWTCDPWATKSLDCPSPTPKVSLTCLCYRWTHHHGETFLFFVFHFFLNDDCLYVEKTLKVSGHDILNTWAVLVKLFFKHWRLFLCLFFQLCHIAVVDSLSISLRMSHVVQLQQECVSCNMPWSVWTVALQALLDFVQRNAEQVCVSAPAIVNCVSKCMFCAPSAGQDVSKVCHHIPQNISSLNRTARRFSIYAETK